MGHLPHNGTMYIYIVLLLRNSYGPEVYDEEVEAYYFETVSDEEESDNTGPSQRSERTGMAESVL